MQAEEAVDRLQGETVGLEFAGQKEKCFGGHGGEEWEGPAQRGDRITDNKSVGLCERASYGI